MLDPGTAWSDSATIRGMKTTWRTRWQQNDIVVYRDEVEVDRLPAERIARVYLVYRGRGDTPNDIAQTVVELAGDEGFARVRARDRLRRPRQFRAAAVLAGAPLHLLGGGADRVAALAASPAAPGAAKRTSAPFAASAATSSPAASSGWQREGPQTWEDRKRRRIERSRPFGYTSGAHA